MFRCALSLTALLVLPVALRAGEPKLPAPDATALKPVIQLVQEVFQEDYAKKTNAGRLALAKKMHQQGLDTKDDMTARYVLFMEVAELAAQAGDPVLACGAIDELDKTHETDVLGLKLEAIAKSAEAGLGPDATRQVFGLCMNLTTLAVTEGKYDLAARIAGYAEAAARKLQEIPLLSQARNRVKEIGDLQAEELKIKAAHETLTKKPDDPEANFLVGVQLCFMRNNWEKGLPLLAKGSDSTLKALAEKDLAKPVELMPQVAVGDGWWDYAETQSGPKKAAAQKRAAKYYWGAVAELTGLPRVRLLKRLLASPGEPMMLVLWNTHNGKHNNYGTTEFDVTLYAEETEVWSDKKVPFEWKRDDDTTMALELPAVAFNRLRLNCRGGNLYVGLSEIIVLKDGANIALGRKATTDSFHSRDPKYGAERVTDGITSSAEQGKGYWATHDQKSAWIEVDLMQKAK